MKFIRPKCGGLYNGLVVGWGPGRCVPFQGLAVVFRQAQAKPGFPPYLLGVLKSKIWKFPSKADSTSKFKEGKRLASPTSEHKMSTETWGNDEISLTGRSKQLICSQSKHSSSQGSAKQRAETPLSFAFFPPHMCSLKEQRKLRSQSFFSIL